MVLLDHSTYDRTEMNKTTCKLILERTATATRRLVKQRVDVGLWTLSENIWHSGVAPEVGLLVPLGSGVQGSVNAKYNYAASAGGPSRKHSYFGLNPRIRVDE